MPICPTGLNEIGPEKEIGDIDLIVLDSKVLYVVASSISNTVKGGDIFHCSGFKPGSSSYGQP